MPSGVGKDGSTEKTAPADSMIGPALGVSWAARGAAASRKAPISTVLRIRVPLLSWSSERSVASSAVVLQRYCRRAPERGCDVPRPAFPRG